MKLIHLFIILFLVSCSDEIDRTLPSQNNDDNTNNENAINILFIGNSLTLANGGIDFHVQKLYEAGNPDVIVETHSVSVAGASLKEHLMSGIAVGNINSKDWDYIILQENGVIATINPEETIESILAFKEEINTSTSVYLFMTWAYEGQPEMTEQLSSVYYEASELTNYNVIPVGLGWRDLTNENKEIELLHSDGVHPTTSGTFYASSMIFSILSNQNIFQVDYNGGIPSNRAKLIKQSVLESIQLYY